jgi:hypothetical protein
MEVAIPGDPDGRVALAARAAVARVGLELAPGRGRQGSVWWQAGLADAADRAPARVVVPLAYDAARSPRRTRGATRA